MCDAPAKNDYTGWQGWNAFSDREPGRALGDWVDLTHELSPAVPRAGVFAPPTIQRIADMPDKALSLTRIETVVHMGTHVDAPRHFFLDGPAMEAIPLTRLTGRGVVLHVDAAAGGSIEPADLERDNPLVEPGDIVALHTGWSQKWDTVAWADHPSLSDDAARWLRDRRIKLLAVDTATPDLPFDRRGPDFAYPVHRTLLAEGILVAELLANLRTLASRRVEFIFGPLPIAGSDGSPARILARPVVA